MKKIKLINFLGIGFVVLGLTESLINRYSCTRLCPVCSLQQNSPCFFLFLLVGIMFAVSGASLIMTNNFRKTNKK